MTTSYQAFGQMTAQVGDEVRTLTRRRESDLLALLIVAQGRPVSADRILLELGVPRPWPRVRPRSRSPSPGCAPGSTRSAPAPVRSSARQRATPWR